MRDFQEVFSGGEVGIGEFSFLASKNRIRIFERCELWKYYLEITRVFVCVLIT